MLPAFDWDEQPPPIATNNANNTIDDTKNFPTICSDDLCMYSLYLVRTIAVHRGALRAHCGPAKHRTNLEYNYDDCPQRASPKPCCPIFEKR
jgi:hypothetical protein